MTTTSIGTATESVYFGVRNLDMVKGLQDVAFDLKFALVTLPTITSQGGTTAAIALWKNTGIKKLLGIVGWAHSTTDSVIVTEIPTTTVNNDELMLTIGSAVATDAKRVFLLIGV